MQHIGLVILVAIDESTKSVLAHRDAEGKISFIHGRNAISLPENPNLGKAVESMIAELPECLQQAILEVKSTARFAELRREADGMSGLFAVMIPRRVLAELNRPYDYLLISTKETQFLHEILNVLHASHV